jgi:hypothetical protein
MPTGTRSVLPKSREMRLRNAAKRQGLRLEKSRRRDPLALDFGRYWLIDNRVNRRVLGGDDGATLDDVEEYLTRGRTS